MDQEKAFKGAIFDTDGVITQTATLHAKAWKSMFDSFLEKLRGKDTTPFDIENDYTLYIDGKARLDGIRSFLQSRKIPLEEGDESDPDTADTIHGLGARKNALFLEILNKEGVKAFPDALDLIKRWKGKKRLAVISASKNCRYILEAAGVLEDFEVRVDGVIAEQKHLNGKPEPDIFLEACAQLGLKPTQCILFEDAIAGVEAGKKGGFGLVVGIARNGGEKELKKNGADFVVSSLENIEEKILKNA